MIKTDTHLFALHAPKFWGASDKLQSIKEIHQGDFLHRLVKVLRASLHDQFIFFDSAHHGLVEIVQISKKDISVRVLTFQKNIASDNHITFLLPLLKKEALEEAVYSLSEIGVETIQLVVTQKSRQKLLHEKEFERLENIVIAACEQSKHYSMVTLLPPKSFHEVINLLPDGCKRIVFDVAGKSFIDLRSSSAKRPSSSNFSSSDSIRGPVSTSSTLLVGPEGGLTQAELDQAADRSFQSCALTATTLRAVQAVAVGAALFKLS